MKEIKILGMGCPKCKKLEEITRSAATELGIEFTLEKVADLDRIMDYGVMVTPALVVNGEVKVAGKVPGKEEVKTLLS